MRNIINHFQSITPVDGEIDLIKLSCSLKYNGL